MHNITKVLRHALDTSNNKYADIDEEDDFQVRKCCGMLIEPCACAVSCSVHQQNKNALLFTADFLVQP
jgi:hypothetical protein